MRRLRLASATVAVVLLAACSGSDAVSIDRSAGGAPSEIDEGSRPDAEGSRPGADPSQPPAPSPAPPKGPLYRAASDKNELASFTLDMTDVTSDGTIRLVSGKGHEGSDPQPSGYYGGSFYNGGDFRYGTAISPVFEASAPFDSVTPSFEALTPPGTWIHIKVSARIAGTWTKEYSLGVWADGDSTIRRHSVANQADANGDVETDTLELTKPADALRITTVLFSETKTASPILRAVSAIATKKGATSTATQSDQSAWGKVLAVPKRSQMIYPGGGEVWCSPTSTSMLLDYWADTLGANGLRETPPQAADRCHDHVYNGTGNWPFNTAHAAAMDGGRLHGFVTRLSSFSQLERLTNAGVPAAISVRYAKGQLEGAPIASTNGHLIVVKGFSANGNVVCNDPAFGSDASVEVTYDRKELTNAWQASMGTTYVVWPANKTLPADPLGAF